MTDKNDMDAFLDDVFAQARTDDRAEVSDDFMARILADAQMLQPQPKSLAPEEPQNGFWANLFDTIGGWQGAGGLAAATMASVFIGFSGAEALTIEGLQTVLTGDADYYISDFGSDFGQFVEGE